MNPDDDALNFVENVLNIKETLDDHTAPYVYAPTGLGVVCDLTPIFRQAFEKCDPISDVEFSSKMTALSLQGISPLAFKFNQRNLSYSKDKFALITPSAFRIEADNGTSLAANGDLMRVQFGTHEGRPTVERIIRKLSTTPPPQEPSFLSHSVPKNFIGGQ